MMTLGRGSRGTGGGGQCVILIEMQGRRKVQLLGAVAAALVAAQLLQPARPPLKPSPRPPAWENPELDKRIASILQRSCRDCHSNETRWPWYSRVSPASWLLIWDVARARRQLNLSHQWNFSETERGEIADAVHNHSMPPRSYLWMHADARLADDERKLFDRWADGELD